MSIPLILCGRIPSHVEGISRILNGQGYEMTHTFHDFATASQKLPAIAHDPSTRPRALIIGRGFSDDEQNELIKTASSQGQGPGIAFLVARPELLTPELKAKIGYAWDGNGPPPVEVLAGRIRESLRLRGIEAGGVRAQGLEEDGVFGF
ncbi:hypothetical protein CAC42_8239 [Sphaceloma murrayae]|uniref:Uncharacterized protein n=1 Tax=Sphaceloma murrayae TaxID=2082308 RepID=A0A2K1QJA4_9PEZI|nr:hypothetical protein CAC42_8239 [Sphaceloma murrayae]